MFQIIIVSHGLLAKEIFNSAQMIAGQQTGVQTVGLIEGQSPENFAEKVDAAVAKCGGDGILILSDLYGGTPCNTVAMKVLPKHENTEMITGMNLSMVIESFSLRSGKLQDAVNELIGIGKDDVMDIRKEFAVKSSQSDNDE